MMKKVNNVTRIFLEVLDIYKNLVLFIFYYVFELPTQLTLTTIRVVKKRILKALKKVVFNYKKRIKNSYKISKKRIRIYIKTLIKLNTQFNRKYKKTTVVPNILSYTSLLLIKLKTLLRLLTLKLKRLTKYVFYIPTLVTFKINIKLLTKYKKRSIKLHKQFNKKAFSLIKTINTKRKAIATRKYSISLPFRPLFVIKAVLFNFVLFLMLIGGLIFYYQILFTLPDPDNIKNYRPKQTTYIYDSQDILLYKTYKGENRTLVKLAAVPDNLKNALIAIEDTQFRQHKGVSPFSIVRAAYANYKNQEITQGASTITQQLIKNVMLNPEQTWERKIKEIILALIIDYKYSKDEILEMYINTVPFGGTAYGVQEASLMYYNKNVGDLNLAESSMLAGLPVAPSDYSPYINFEAAKRRQKSVLVQMVKENYITLDQALAAYEENLEVFYPQSNINYPHFVYYVTEYIESKYGTNMLYNGGLKVHTTLEPTIQEMAQKYVFDEINSIRHLNISNGAALVTKNKTGEIVAMVGSKDYRAEDIDGFVNVTTSLRQPGSSIKPFNYSLALENGMTAATIIKDEAVVYKTPGSEPYVPKNYDGKFRGNVTIRRSLANSLNIPAVKILEKNGVTNFVTYMRKFGITTWNNDYYGLSLSLGAAEVKMTEMNTAYSVFANEGKKVNITGIKYIELPNGDILEYNPCLQDKSFLIGKKVIYQPGNCETTVTSKENAFIIKSILSDFNARSEAFGTNSILNVQGTAVKTGTTNDLKDNWALGFNEEYTVGTWVGNNDGARMSYVASGITGASPIWANIITELTNENNYINKDVPEGIIEANICGITGTLSCGSCPGYKEYFIAGTEPKNKCSNDYIKDYNKKRKND